MKNIKDLTEQDCIHCRTREEWDEILKLTEVSPTFGNWELYKENTYLRINGVRHAGYGTISAADRFGYTIHPASDFLTPTVNVLTEIGDCKVIKNGGDVIVMTGNVVITLTPPVLKHIQELMKSIGL
jgi:hypothetical protein